MSQRILASGPPSSSSRRSDGPGLLFGGLFLGILVGAAIGWFIAIDRENQSDLDFHIAAIKPWLKYNPKFYEMRPRALNDDMRFVAYQMHCIVAEGLNLREVLDRAMPAGEVPSNMKQLTMDRLLENYEQAEAYGRLHSKENLILLQMGRSPVVSKGEYKGQRADVEHIVPKAVVPNVDNILLNLEWLPQKLNISKSDTITERAYLYAERYHDAKVMNSQDFAKVLELFQKEQ